MIYSSKMLALSESEEEKDLPQVADNEFTHAFKNARSLHVMVHSSQQEKSKNDDIIDLWVVTYLIFMCLIKLDLIAIVS